MPLPSAPDAESRPATHPPKLRRSIQRRRSGGGAWKVAYADFVTAMMALFIVLWMMNSSRLVKQSISGYFHDPKGYTRRLGAGPAGSGEALTAHRSQLGEIQRQIEAALQHMPDFQRIRRNIRLSVTGEGLRIELLEDEQGTFFVSGSPEPTNQGGSLLGALASELSKLPNRVVIEGHTDARPFRNVEPAAGYGNWELSVDRANAARRLLHAQGVRPEQVVEVRGFADQNLLDPANPLAATNRRISVVVKLYLPAE